jgi:amphi-Trp domain-containing protein
MKSEDRRSRSDVANFLKDIALKTDAGSLTFRQGSEELVFNIPDTLSITTNPSRVGMEFVIRDQFFFSFE